jgi:hypothetical protein
LQIGSENKALALSGRTETRDNVDILELGRLFSLEAIVWADFVHAERRAGPGALRCSVGECP